MFTKAMINNNQNNVLQSMCRGYLVRLRHIAVRHGLCSFVDDIVSRNAAGRCVATRKEVEILSRMCDDERVMRSDIPNILGKSYRRCFADGDFEKVDKLKSVGIYSKISAYLLGAEQKEKENKSDESSEYSL
jgi:hypothetical protein